MGAFMNSISHPSELFAMLEYKLVRPAAVENPAVDANGKTASEARFRSYDYLNRTSRSFAAVIKELDEELMDPVCLFYVILRGLDTVEDDMTLPLDLKVAQLRSFHEDIYKEGWTFTKSGPNEKDRDLLVHFNYVIEHFLSINPVYQTVIADITRRMGYGMAEFCTRRVATVEDYNLYCHYVAGLVGVGLSKLFAASKLEGEVFSQMDDLSNSMGLFLQKTNIIRDFLEDHLEGRLFWPREIWSEYCNDPEELCADQNLDKALACLNHMCMNALEHIPDAIEYMSRIRNQSVFNFCAIPQVMAISTITLVFNNPEVFKRNVKIRKGLACKLIMEAQNVDVVRAIFLEFLNEMARKNNNARDPNYVRISTLIAQVRWRLHTRPALDSPASSERLRLPLGMLNTPAQVELPTAWARVPSYLLHHVLARRCGPTSSLGLRLTDVTKTKLAPDGHWKRPASGLDTWANVLSSVAIGATAFLAARYITVGELL
ncbi:isoprenoid synthase domain-containing protein [Thamnocephalis sphaerospora]|uniref:Squalene synthase n=1 Tax=Thamnocephalis sphaerospora TaxID=78915 RepID=A0A4P9XTY1_9FUNG|nr:isoprenoid synthase domain-containing protein [Thamnocephalis sphaerospora]|eukprot:RKP09657.1 isoprenoid synthase domain-containing protein [Thamnocephalis sphaerospora]